MLIRLYLDMRILKIELQMFKALLCEHHVPPPACGFGHMILKKPMDKVDIRADHFTNVAHFLDYIIAVMGDELQIKGWDMAAGVAGTSRCPLHGSLFIAKSHIGGFDQFKKGLTPRDP